MNIRKRGDGKKKKDAVRAMLRKNREFLIVQLRREWDKAERSAKRVELIQRAKASAAVIAKGLLILLAVAGVITVTVVAPNLFAAVGRIRGRRRFYYKPEFQRAVQYLKKKHYIDARRDRDAGEYNIKLTSEGADIVLVRSLQDLKVVPQEKWDGQWRIVIFDIPDHHKWARDAFRRKLREMGFYRLQESVFVFPHECEREISFLTALYDIPEYIRLVRSSDVSYDTDLRDFFLLS